MFFSLILENSAGDQINMTATVNESGGISVHRLSPLRHECNDCDDTPFFQVNKLKLFQNNINIPLIR